MSDFAAYDCARELLWERAMSSPREYLPRQFYLVTRRCTQRQFLLRPDAATNNALIYCLALAAERTGVTVLLAVVESNHHHTVIFDPEARCAEFAEHFHKLVAKSQNALRGRWENVFAAEEPGITRLVDRADVIAKLIYTASNPVKDRLVERAHQWPGVTGYASLLNGRALHARRPRHFFRNPGPMPEEVTLQLSIPRELGPANAVLDELRHGVEAVEQAMAEDRRRTGARVLGRRRVLEQSWRDAPQSVEPRRKLRPRFAARDEVSRVTALLRYRAFLDAYREARARWLAGLRAIFPAGTYWLRRFAAVSVEPLPSPT